MSDCALILLAEQKPLGRAAVNEARLLRKNALELDHGLQDATGQYPISNPFLVTNLSSASDFG